MTINNERLAKFEGKCWHEVEFDATAMISWTNAWVCKHCGERFIAGISNNPSYSTSPADRERLWGYLMGKEMWKEFWNYSVENWVKSRWQGGLESEHVKWLFLPLDGVPRWVSLLSEWLGMESTREKFGTTECEDSMVAYPDCVRINCNCSGTGKIRAEWAKV
jgi:hypothetical protein